MSDLEAFCQWLESRLAEVKQGVITSRQMQPLNRQRAAPVSFVRSTKE